MSYRISIQEDRCSGCGSCSVACPVTTAKRIEGSYSKEEFEEKPVIQIVDGVAKIVDEESCRLCGVCISVCPTEAISIVEIKS